LASLERGRLPIREAGLEDLWEMGRNNGRLSITGGYETDLAGADFVFLAVGTPSRDDGAADISQVEAATRSVARSLAAGSGAIIVLKSTVPLGTAERVAEILAEEGRGTLPVISNPEFLREGQAIRDFMRPDRVVIGGSDQCAREAVAALYQPLKRPIVQCSNRAAELIKYASNAFLCTKVSFMNEMAAICEATGTDVLEVSRAVGMDPRIGHSYLDAGLGWGGSCLPKDLRALMATASAGGLHTPLLDGAMQVNGHQVDLVAGKLRSLLGGLGGASVCLLGLAFKPNCDDVRESPALALAAVLAGEGATVHGYDPVAMDNAAAVSPGIIYHDDPYGAAAGADAVVLATGWNAFEHLDFTRLALLVARPILVDARNTLRPEAVIAAGFSYSGVGRVTRTAEALSSAAPDRLEEAQQHAG
jgi:UDPglucose 6-dehydrogenase